MAVDISEVEVTEAGDAGAEAVSTALPGATNGIAGATDALALMLDGLKESHAATAEPTPEGEPAATDGEPEPAAPAKAPSRRARTVERVLTEAEQKVADAEAARTAAEARAEEAEKRLQEREQAPSVEAEQARTAQLVAEHGAWLGTPEEYAEAQRWSLMDNADPAWDFDRHQREVARLNAFNERRKWAGVTTAASEHAGRVQALADVNRDFLVTLAEDLPEDRREAYRTHKDGIPGAVRYYAETIYGPQLEAKDAVIAERDAEIERLRTTGGDRRGLGQGGAGTTAAPPADYKGSSPEELMSAGLREQARAAERRR